jgi:hypothetical protein
MHGWIVRPSCSHSCLAHTSGLESSPFGCGGVRARCPVMRPRAIISFDGGAHTRFLRHRLFKPEVTPLVVPVITPVEPLAVAGYAARCTALQPFEAYRCPRRRSSYRARVRGRVVLVLKPWASAATLLVGGGVLWLCFSLGVYVFTRTGREVCGSNAWRPSAASACRWGTEIRAGSARTTRSLREG